MLTMSTGPIHSTGLYWRAAESLHLNSVCTPEIMTGKKFVQEKDGLVTFSVDNPCKYTCFWFSNLLEDKQMKPGVTDSSS